MLAQPIKNNSTAKTPQVQYYAIYIIRKTKRRNEITFENRIIYFAEIKQELHECLIELIRDDWDIDDIRNISRIEWESNTKQLESIEKEST